MTENLKGCELVGIRFSGPMGDLRSASQYLKERNIFFLPSQLVERGGEVVLTLASAAGRHVDHVRKEDGVVWIYARAFDVDPGAPRTFDLKNVEVFRTGKWTDSAGRETEYTPDDLAAMAAAHYELAGEFDAPVKLGHDKEQALLSADGLPAAGWLHNLRPAGDTLIADIKDIPKKVYDIMKAGGFRKRSLEVLHNFRPDGGGRVYPHVVAGLALLGAKLPALSLSDIRNFYSQEESGADYPYSFDEGITRIPNGGEEPMDERLEELAVKIDELFERIEALESRLDGTDEEEDEDEALEETMAEETDATQDEPAEAPAMAEFRRRLAAKLPPKEHGPYLRHYSRLSGNARARFREFVGNLPNAPELGEYGRYGGTGRGFDAQEESIRAYCARNGLDADNAAHYARAALAVCEYRRPE